LTDTKFKFFVQKIAREKTEVLPLTDEEFRHVELSRKTLNSAYTYLEKYYCIFESYKELELEAQSLSLNHLLYNNENILDFFKGRSVLQRRLMTLLVSGSLYLKTAKNDLLIMSQKSITQCDFDEIKRQVCENNKSFNILIELRDHSQHVDFPIWNFGYYSEVNEIDDKFDYEVTFGVSSQMLEKSSKRNKREKSQIESLTGKFDLREGAKEYFSCLTELHNKVWQQVSSHLERAKSTLSDCEVSWIKLNPDKTSVGVAATKYSQQDSMHPLLTYYLKIQQDQHLDYILKKTTVYGKMKKRRVRQTG
jgi:hypothetical protein